MLPKLATHASRTEAVCLCDETNEEAGTETQKDRAATLPITTTRPQGSRVQCSCWKYLSVSTARCPGRSSSTISLTNSGDCMTHVELVWHTHHDNNSTRRLMSTVLMVKVPSVLSPRHHTHEDRQAQCHQRTPATGSSCRTHLHERTERCRHVVAHVVGDAHGKALVVLLPTAIVLTRTSDAQVFFLDESSDRFGLRKISRTPQDWRRGTWRTARTVLWLTRKSQRCLGVLTARMTPTAQAGRKSWYVSASRGMRRKNAPTQRLVASPRRTLMPTKRRKTTTTKVENWPAFG